MTTLADLQAKYDRRAAAENAAYLKREARKDAACRASPDWRVEDPAGERECKLASRQYVRDLAAAAPPQNRGTTR